MQGLVCCPVAGWPVENRTKRKYRLIFLPGSVRIKTIKAFKQKEETVKIGKIVLILGIVSMIVSIFSRVAMKPLPPVNLEAGAALQFAGVCFLLSIALSLTEKK